MFFPISRLISGALLLLLAPTVANAYQQCYYPDGSEAKDYTFVECYTPSTDASSPSRHAPCCIPSEGDICQTSGLCYWPKGKTLYRGACTDPTWQDPACQAMSICADTKPRKATWMYVQKCIGDEWQCGALDGVNHGLAGCNDKDEEFEDMIQTRATTMAALTTFATASTDSSTPTSTGNATDEAANEQTSTPAPGSTSSSGGLSKGAIAGIAVGGWAVFTLLASIAWYCGRLGKGQASSANPNRTHGWDDDPWNQNTSGFGRGGETGMVEYGSAPSNITSNFYSTAASRGDIYQPNAGYGAANDPSKNEVPHEEIHEIESEIGANTLVPIGLAIAAKNGRSGGSPPYASPVSDLDSPLPMYQPPPAELPSARPAMEMDGCGRP